MNWIKLNLKTNQSLNQVRKSQYKTDFLSFYLNSHSREKKHRPIYCRYFLSSPNDLIFSIFESIYFEYTSPSFHFPNVYLWFDLKMCLFLWESCIKSPIQISKNVKYFLAQFNPNDNDVISGSKCILIKRKKNALNLYISESLKQTN